MSPYENFGQFAAPGAVPAWEPCGKEAVRAIWEESVDASLAEPRLSEFFSRHEAVSLAMMHVDDVARAADEAQTANVDGHLLLREWFVVGMRLRRKRIARHA